MKVEDYFNQDTLHHAYLVVSKDQNIFSLLKERVEKLIEGDIAKSPDVFIFEHDTFGIDEAREVIRRQSQRNFLGRQFFIIKPETITTEAQNALLKTLEDPTTHTHFIMVMKHEGLLPTLLSRMVVIRDDKGREVAEKMGESFLLKVPKERIEYVRKLVEDHNTEEIQLLLNSLEKIYTKDIKKEKAIKETASILALLWDTRCTLEKPGASKRMILEHLAASFSSQ